MSLPINPRQTKSAAAPPPANAETFRLDEGNTFTDPTDMEVEQELQQLMAYRSRGLRGGDQHSA